MAMAVGSGSGGAKADMNVTPLIDVLLVLLIIFMVITPLTPYGLDAIAPQPPPPNSPPPPSDLRTVVIQVDKDRSAPSGVSFKINQDPIEESKLQDRLVQIFSTRAERTVFIRGDKDLEFEPVARAIDIAKGAGIDKIGLMTPKIEQGQ